MKAGSLTIEPKPRKRRFAARWSLHLYPQVIAAIIVGILVGAILPSTGVAVQPLGDAFVKLVKMIISPVIFLTIATGVANMQGVGALGRVAGKAFAYFLVFSTLALVLGLVVANVVRPGEGLNINPASLDANAALEYAHKAEGATIASFLLDIIPTTAISSLTSGSILQTLLVAVLTGLALMSSGPAGEKVTRWLELVSQVVFKLVAILMRAAPIGAFGAMAFTIGKYGIGSLLALGKLVLTFYATSLVFVLVVLGLVARQRLFDPPADHLPQGGIGPCSGDIFVRSRASAPA